MRFLTSSFFGMALTLITLALCFASMIVIDGERLEASQRKVILAVTAVAIAVWQIDVIARFLYVD